MNKSFRKIVGGVLLTSIIASSSPILGAGQRFKDVPSNYWAYGNIEAMASKGFISGYEDGSFKPKASLTFLEAMSLLERLSSPSPSEKTYAMNTYADLVNSLKVPSWARESVAYLLNKGILTEAELRTVHSRDAYLKPMQKQDTAVYLAKVLGMESEANSLSIILLGYKDEQDILSSNRKYIKVLQDHNIISKDGEGDGNFKPKSALSREVMATMMANGSKYMEKNPPVVKEPEKKPDPIEKDRVLGSVLRITNETGRDYLVIEDSSLRESGYVLTSSSKIVIDGKTASKKDLVEGLEVDIEFTKNNKEIDTIYGKSKLKNLSGLVKSISSTSIEVEYKDGASIKTDKYQINSSTKLYVNNKSADLKDIKKGDLVDLEIRNGQVTLIDVEVSSSKLEGILLDLRQVVNGRDKYFEITVKDKDDRDHKLIINDDSRLYREGRGARPEDLRPKDEIKLTSEFDLKDEKYYVKELDAEVVRSNITGHVIEITNRFGQNTLVKIRNSENKKEETYELTSESLIYVDNKLATSLPANPGYSVFIRLEGDLVTRIEVDTISLEESFIARVESVNTRQNHMEIVIDSLSLDFNTRTLIVYFDSNTKVFNKDYSPIDAGIEYFRKGDTINILGTYSGPNFVAKSVVIR